MLKIIIPMAGSSELFQKAGYHYPKPLVEINGKSMIELVLEHLKTINEPHQFVFILREEDTSKFHLDNTLKLLAPDSKIIKIKNETKGGLCSVLMTIDFVAPDDSLLIVNSDQILQINYQEVNDYWHKNDVDAGVLCFKSVHPRYSYVKIDGQDIVQTEEKNPISNLAIAGYYYFKSADVFFKSAFNTILNDVQINNAFYISSVINEYILDNKEVTYQIIDNSIYYSFYSPKLISEYEAKFKS